MTRHEVIAAQPATLPADHDAALIAARQRMVATGQWSAGQLMGRRWPIGCVALEITQRCNLDCTACYLSEHSEAVKDLPLEELFNRIDMIFDHYGPHTDVQVTGGDPTLRKREELVAIVRRIRDKGMRPTLFTNGIRAKRDLLQELVIAGLVDVAFHVDMTQQRSGYADEIALNALRQEYIDRTRGLGLPVMFNTTVISDNFEQVPEIVAFFVRNSDAVRLASFQLQADTGRGILGQRDTRITIGSVRRQIELGANTPLSFDTAQAGHARCNRYAMTLVINGKVYDVLDDPELFNDVLECTAELPFDRQSRSAAVRTLLQGVLTSPRLALRGAVWLGRKVWRARADLVRARGRIDKLSFFVHDFMDACQLDKERVDACVFTAATSAGPISMCLHNAKRDAFILQPVRLGAPQGVRYWNPLSGVITPAPIVLHGPIALRHKVAKGRLKRGPAATRDGRALRTRVNVAAHSRARFAGAARIAGALTLVLIVAALGLFSAIAAPTRVPDPTPAVEELSVHEWEALWSSVLMRRVDDAGRIDFAGLSQDHADLDRVVAFVAAVDPASRPRQFPDRISRLAFYINAYNALAMHGVVDAGVPQSLRGLTKFSFFYLRKFVIGGKSISLYDLENQVIRPLGEERVHFALNCMVVSCPRLPRAVFTADALDRQLDVAARSFIGEARNVRVEPAKGEVWLSAIFDFYPEDFLKRAPSLIAYVNRYRMEPIPPDFKVRFDDYDWTVNARGRIGAS